MAPEAARNKGLERYIYFCVKPEQSAIELHCNLHLGEVT